MWQYSESTSYPDLIDSKSSKRWVYVRRNIVENEREIDGIKEKFYSYEEQKIPKDVYTIFESQIVSESRLDEIEEVLTEIVGGGLI